MASMPLAVLVVYGCIVAACAIQCQKSAYTSRRGSVTGRPDVRRPAENCTIDVKGPTGSFLVLRWYQFFIYGQMPRCDAEDGDSVAVYIGCSPTLLTKFCSSTEKDLMPHDIYTVDNCLRIVYTAKAGSFSLYGFRATYEITSSIDRVSNNKTCSESVRNATSGVIFSPLWPDRTYLQNDCRWKIIASADMLIQINIMQQTGDCGSSSSNGLVVNGSKSRYPSPETMTFSCGNDSPFSLETKCYEVDLQHVTNRRRILNGFMLGYVAYQPAKVKPTSSGTTNCASVIVWVGLCLVTLKQLAL